LPARRLLKGFRDLGVSEDPHDRLACEPSFNRYTAFWILGETLDAAYAALEGMLLASRERALQAIENMRRQVLSSLGRHFDPQQSRFTTDSSDRTRGLFAAHTAIGVMRSLEGLPSNRPLTWTGFRKYLDRTGYGAPVHAREGLENLLAGCREGDAVVENPQRPLIPTITALYTASSILWFLGEGTNDDRDGGLSRFIDRRRLERFLRGCLKRQRVDDWWIAGFVMHPDHEELCVNTTYFGLKLMERLGVALEPGCDREIEAFLTLSERDGGFSSTRREPRSLNATLWGLKGLQLVAPPRWAAFVRGRRSSITRFLTLCRNRDNGGAPFAPDLTRYGENCLATRYWLQIHELLGLDLSVADRERAFEFFRWQGNESTGGFRAYPEDLVDLRGFGADDLERFLAEKDDKLLRYHHRKLHDLEQAPSYAPDTRMIALYDRLAALEREEMCRELDPVKIRAELDAVWKELRARQEAEAARFEARFDEEVLAPLRAGRAELAALRERSLDR
jgi:hypothetical protein